MNRIFTKDVARLRYFKLTQDNFNTLSFGRDITSSKTQDILELLSDMVDNPVTLYYSNLNCYVTSGGIIRVWNYGKILKSIFHLSLRNFLICGNGKRGQEKSST